MSAQVRDLEAECLALEALLGALDPCDWARRTQFFDWSVADEVMHLMQVDEFGLLALTRPENFPPLVAEVRDGQAKGDELSHRMRRDYGALSTPDLLDRWSRTWRHLRDAFLTAGAGRVPWFGPDMSTDSFAAGRQMEVWAHGQDIYDILGRSRADADRIRNICDLGVRTRGWSFRSRGIDKPAAPAVRLTGPSGAVWAWNDDAQEVIEGEAVDFALVVTQRRHVDDTGLVLRGGDARRWMEIAQCFAGVAEQGPGPGERYRIGEAATVR